MFENTRLLANLYTAAGLGLFAGLLLVLLRRFAPAVRVRRSVIGAAITWALYLLLDGLALASLESLGKFLHAVSIMLSANILLQIFDLLIWDYFLNRRKANVPRLLMEVFNVSVMITVALGVLNRVFDADLSTLLVTSTVLSAVIGLALQDMLGNLISGVALQLDRPFDIQDWIQVNGEEGEVVRMNWRTITIRNIDNQYVTIANASMVREIITNYSRPTREQRMHFKIGLPYGTPPGEVKRILLPAILGAAGVSRAPAPDILAEEYGDFAIQYDIRYWITDYSKWPETRDAVLSRIWYALNRAGISVPFPIRDINLRQVSDELEQQARARQRRDIFNQLRPLQLFAPFDDAQIEQLAANSDLQRYQAGETLVQQGEVGDSLFVVKSGTARVDIHSGKNYITTVATRVPGDYFGEMSLLTGERRSASVIAETEMEVIIVDKEAIAEVLSTDLNNLEELTRNVQQRLSEIHEHLTAAEQASVDEVRNEDTGLFQRIARFLGLG